MAHHFPCLLLLFISCQSIDTPTPQQRVYDHVKTNAHLTFRPPSGSLRYAYLVPSGPYEQLWDWDSLFMGVALFPFGSAPYLAGSMANFLDHTNLTTGQVQGCLLPTGGTGTIFHAKPVVIQGAWLASQQPSVSLPFQQFQPQMKAQLKYWSSPLRTDKTTGLPKWYNQLESGQDNLVLSTCASNRSKCWDPALHEMVLVSADVATFLYREYQAYALFNGEWAAQATETKQQQFFLNEQKRATTKAVAIKAAVNLYLWNEERGYYIALNTSTAAINAGTTTITARTDVGWFPLWAGMPNRTQAHILKTELMKPDMFSSFGVRSTSSNNARYNNIDEIKPYSNWQGPVWVNANAVLSFGLLKYKYHTEAKEMAKRVVFTLANDLIQDNTFHEGYDSETGKGLAARGFLSWDTLGATWPGNVDKGIDPFAL